MAKAKGDKATKKPAKDGSRRGGARPNSGPKPKRVKVAVAALNAAVDLAKVEDIETIVLAKLAAWAPQCLDNLKILADGVKVKDTAPDGTVDYFAEPPDRQANEYLLNRLLGKPTERKELTGKDGDPLKAYVGFDPDEV